MSIRPKLAEAVNNQIQLEFQSAYLYLSMSAWFTQNNLPGCAHWMHLQWQEETQHALKLFKFLHDRGGNVVLQALAAPNEQYSTALDVFKSVQAHEELITSAINDLYEVAIQEKDLPLQVVLQWFINEQVEEESQVGEIVDQFTMIGSDGPSVYLLDRQLASRTATSGSSTN
ncbi:MAG: ferritin [Ignavibacteria bacterium]|nr:ferritin [Ignavibacteria bacterium]